MKKGEMKSLTLIGMSGVGKSTVGKLCAMGTRQFFDTDRMIEKECDGESVDSIVGRLGPEAFLEYESQCILGYRWPEHLPFIVSTGGSVVYVEETMKFLREITTVVYLKTTFDVIASRAPLDGRGIVSRDGSSFEEVFRERESLYEAWAHHTVNANQSPIGVSLAVRACVE